MQNLYYTMLKEIIDILKINTLHSFLFILCTRPGGPTETTETQSVSNTAIFGAVEQ